MVTHPSSSLAQDGESSPAETSVLTTILRRHDDDEEEEDDNDDFWGCRRSRMTVVTGVQVRRCCRCHSVVPHVQNELYVWGKVGEL